MGICKTARGSAGGRGYKVRIEGEFDRALTEAWASEVEFSLIEVQLGKLDACQPLRRLTERLGERV